MAIILHDIIKIIIDHGIRYESKNYLKKYYYYFPCHIQMHLHCKYVSFIPKSKLISINYNNFSSSHASQCDAFYNDVVS